MENTRKGAELSPQHETESIVYNTATEITTDEPGLVSGDSTRKKGVVHRRTKSERTPVKFTPPVELGWLLEEQRQKCQPPSVWANPSLYQSKPGLEPPNRSVRNSPPPQACPAKSQGQPVLPKLYEDHRLLWNTKTVCEALGEISPRALSRLEKAGLIRSVGLLRHKSYAREDVVALIENLRNWKPQQWGVLRLMIRRSEGRGGS